MCKQSIFDDIIKQLFQPKNYGLLLLTFLIKIQVEELRTRLEEKNKLIEKKTQQTMAITQEKNKFTQELQELRDHIDIKDRKINVLQRKVLLFLFDNLLQITFYQPLTLLKT